MLNMVLGWVLIVSGVLFFLNPEKFRKKLQKKSLKQVKRILFFIIILLSGFLISAGWKVEGILSKVIVVLGILGVVKAVFLLKAKAADKILEWWLKQPVIFFKVSAVAYVLL
ncbi:MAG: hypothetical protein ABIH71_05075, partial [Candidatus Omnitrophota bacterium]